MNGAEKGSGRTPRKVFPRFGSGILADGFSVADGRKYNAQGIFTVVWAWGLPSQRRFCAIITLFRVLRGQYTMVLSLRKRGAKTIDTSQVSHRVEIQSREKGYNTLTIPAFMTFRFDEYGSYEVVCSFDSSPIKLKIPFEVRQKEWPVFTKEEKRFATSKPDAVTSLRANISCIHCSHAYVFEESIVQDLSPVGGVQRFPKSGEFECVECKHIMNLRDIQGQLRASLKGMIQGMMKREA